MTYIVLLEEREVTDYPNPHQERGGSQQDATQVIRGHILSEEKKRYFMDTDSTISQSTHGKTIAVSIISIS